jgi:arylsulfatase A
MAFKILKLVFVLGIISMFITGCEQKESTLIRPNIVLIMADDMGYECVGANGNTEYETPNLDRLAASGIGLKIVIPSRCAPLRG